MITHRLSIFPREDVCQVLAEVSMKIRIPNRGGLESVADRMCFMGRGNEDGVPDTPTPAMYLAELISSK